MERFTALIGFFGILLIAWALSADRRAIRWRTVGWGLALQIAIAVLVLKGTQIAALFSAVALPIGRPVAALVFIVFTTLVGRLAQRIAPGPVRRAVWSGYAAVSVYLFLAYNLLAFLFQAMKDIVNNLIGYTQEGTRFVFGNLGVSDSNVGLVLATQVLPTIIFIASIFAVLYYLGVMQLVVRFFARMMMRFMGASGAESTSVAASIFMGQTEAPLTIRPFLPEMTRSELMTIMTAGMAHVSGGIMAAYVLVAKVDVIHLLTAVIMTAPGAIMIAKMLVPETGKPTTGGDVEIVVPIQDVNIIDAAGRGAIEGLHLAANVAAMLIAFIALVALVNGVFGYVNGLLPWFPASLDIVLGWLFRPIAWAMGVSWEDSLVVGNLLGTRMVLNEFVAFAMLGQPEVQASLDPRSFVIATYALCGFANFASIAIQIGGIGSLAPSRRADLAQLGLLAMIAGTLANFMTATIAGMLL